MKRCLTEIFWPVQVKVSQEHLYALTRFLSLSAADLKRVSKACKSAAKSLLMFTWTDQLPYASDSQHRKGAVQDGSG